MTASTAPPAQNSISIYKNRQIEGAERNLITNSIVLKDTS